MKHVAFRILGPFEAQVDGRSIDLPSQRERALLAVLLLSAGEVVSTETLVASVWGDPAPGSARHMVHEYVSRLRVALDGASIIVTRAPGYVVERDTYELDAARFAEYLAAARAAVSTGELDAGLEAFDAALGLWRGEVLSDVVLEGDAGATAARLGDQRRAALSERVDVALALGRHHELVPDLERAAAAEPLDERLIGQLMLALYRDGRQSDALARYRESRERLDHELGIEPRAELKALHRAILRHDPALTPGIAVESEQQSALAAARRGSRRHLALAAVAITVVGTAIAAAAVAVGKDHAQGAVTAHGDALAVVDATTGRLVGTTSLGSRPAAIAHTAGSIWISYPDARAVARISPISLQVTASIPLDVPAESLATTAGAVWAVGSNLTDTSLTVDRIDPTFNIATRVQRLPLVVEGDTGSIAGGQKTLVVAPRSGFLTRIDTRTGRVLNRVDPSVPPTAIARGFGSTWLAYREANEVVRVDSTGAITTIPVGRQPSSIAVGRTAVWVADSLDDSVKSIDPATSSVVTTVEVGAEPEAIAENRGSVWVANAGDGTLTRIDERTGRRTRQVTVGASPRALVVANDKVWVSIEPPPPVEPSGGTIVVSVPSGITWFDPAVADAIDDSPIEYAICSALLINPDEAGSAGLQVVPDAARAEPTVSDGGRVYTFMIRKGQRFSPPSNEPVTAETFKYSIERSLKPIMSLGLNGTAPGQQVLTDVIGEAAYVAGKARHISGISAHGYRLTIRLTRPTPDLPERIADSPFCAVPTDMPLKPQPGAFPSSGPYYIATETPGRSLVLLRNPNYRGDRPRRPRRIDIVIGPRHPIEAVEAGKLDYAIDAVTPAQSARLDARYGPHSPAARRGEQQYFVNRGLEVDEVHLNTSRPLFASAQMRRAVNYAVDRRALAARGGAFYANASVAQMEIPPGVPGFRNEHVYPLIPDLAKARGLAGPGHHTAILWCYLGGGGPRAAQIIARNLAAIGIDVQIKCFPGNQYWTFMLTPGAAWDLAVDGGSWGQDPGDWIGGYGTAYDPSHLHDRRVNSLVAVAERKSGLARAFAYAQIDDLLVRDVAPDIVYANEGSHDFFSRRIGCQLNQPLAGMDLGALCIRPYVRP